MKVLSISDIRKEEGYIFYRNKYDSTATLEIMSKEVIIPLKFTVEIGPLGNRTIEFDEQPTGFDYPALPVIKSLKEYIEKMSTEGQLP